MMRESAPIMSLLSGTLSANVLAKTYRGDVPISPYTTPML
jgi:hypothetical protein